MNTGLATPKDGRWRLVCHECGYKWPPNSAINVSAVTCCNSKSTIKIHVHDLDKPCALCTDDFDEKQRARRELESTVSRDEATGADAVKRILHRLRKQEPKQ
jgi:hypothetical protein